AAAAIELVHAASLILDDLPSMDDAPLRRGRRANHLEFGEAIAILAAFGLLNLAFGTLARAHDPPLAGRLAALTSGAVGPDGLIGGQALDLLATERGIDFEMLERIHRGKTGALFVAAATSGALIAGAGPDAIAALAAFVAARRLWRRPTSTSCAAGFARSATSTPASIASSWRPRAPRAARRHSRRSRASASACSPRCCSDRRRRSVSARGCRASSP